MADITHPETAFLKQASDVLGDSEELVAMPRSGVTLDFNSKGWQHYYTDFLRREAPLRAILKFAIPKPSASLSLPLFAERPSMQWTTESHINQSQRTCGNLQARQQVPRRVKSERANGVHLINERGVNHKRRVQKLVELLEPVVPSDGTDESFVFLCWGKESKSRIIPVRVTDAIDEVALLQKLHDAWAIRRGSWRKWLRPLFEIDDVEIVQISLAGRKYGSQNSDEFIGTYAKTDFATERQHLEQSIAQYKPQEFPCPYNPSTGNTDCHSYCISMIVVDDASSPPWSPCCPEAALHTAKRRLQRIKSGPPFLRLAFSQPGLAAESNYLEGEDIVYGHQDILSKVQVWHCSQLWELQFRAVLISERWRFDPRAIALPAIATAFFLMVGGAKLVYGDWATAWNVGCFLVGLATLLGMWTTHAVSK